VRNNQEESNEGWTEKRMRDRQLQTLNEIDVERVSS
jgi:flagellar biosynthesis chaperone FliJ